MDAKLFCVLLLVMRSGGQRILDVLSTHEELSTLNFHINASTTLSSLLVGANNITFLAPSNTAFDAWFGQTSGSLSDELIESTLMYHVLIGGFPVPASDPDHTTNPPEQPPTFARTHLEKGKSANVTGGQVVEVISNLGALQFLSGNKSVTNISSPNILHTGGLIHIVDEVLEIPPDIPVLLTQAKLNFMISILQMGGFLTTSAESTVNGIRLVSDLMTFVPNSQEALSSFTAINANNPSQERLVDIFNYHSIRDAVTYSTGLTDGMQLQSIEGTNVTITKQGNTTFVNGVKIISSDYLISNGVVHVIENLLDPTNITTPPELTTTPAKPPQKTSPPKADTHKAISKVTIALAVVLPVLFCAAVVGLAFWLLKRRKSIPIVERKPSRSSYTRQIETGSGRKANIVLGQDLELDDSPIERPVELPKPYELFTEPRPYARKADELSIAELDGTTAHGR